ncbi:helix-turn-helix domain-containing protein [Anaerostipes sp.]|nr:helix-turn-helix domain-containing protein [Anaerostipes sp.]
MSRRRSMEVIEKAEYVTIGELVRLTDVRYSTLKFYTEEGILPFEQQEENMTRRYRRKESVERISYIMKLRSEKKTIPEIKEILKEGLKAARRAPQFSKR